MSFGTLFDLGIEAPRHHRPAKKKKSLSQGNTEPLGCDYCPLDKVKGIQKIIGDIYGKLILVFAQSPGMDENDEGMELVGRAGQWFWKELAKVGIKRDDVDVQNAVRCLPATLEESSYDSTLKMRAPTAREIKCCSFHTERLLAKHKAKQILVLGQIAAKALLKTKTIPSSKIFWSDQLNARVYLLDHPAYFVRPYAAPGRLKTFRETLQIFARDREKESGELADQFAYIKKQKYFLVLNEEKALKAKAILEKYGRLAVDEEDAPCDVFRCKDCGTLASEEQKEYDKDCQCGGPFTVVEGRQIVCCGFSPKPGLSFVFVFHHKDQAPVHGWKVQAVAKEILENPEIEKSFQYGCSDITKLQEWEHIEVRGFTHDTNYSEWLRFPDDKSYGLDKIAERRFPEFSGYKAVIVKELIDWWVAHGTEE